MPPASGKLLQLPHSMAVLPWARRALPSLGLRFPVFRMRLVTGSSYLRPNGCEQCRTGRSPGTGLPASRGGSCLFCQPRCQQGRVVFEVPPDKGRFGPGAGRAGGSSVVPLLSASQRPSFPGRQGGPVSAESPCPASAGWGQPLPRVPAPTPVLGRSQPLGASPVCGGGRNTILLGGSKSLHETVHIFWGGGGHGGSLPNPGLPNHAPGGGPMVTGLSATNLHPLQEAAAGGPGFPSRVHLLREVCPGRSFGDPGCASATRHAE